MSNCISGDYRAEYVCSMMGMFPCSCGGRGCNEGVLETVRLGSVLRFGIRGVKNVVLGFSRGFCVRILLRRGGRSVRSVQGSISFGLSSVSCVDLLRSSLVGSWLRDVLTWTDED